MGCTHWRPTAGQAAPTTSLWPQDAHEALAEANPAPRKEEPMPGLSVVKTLLLDPGAAVYERLAAPFARNGALLLHATTPRDVATKAHMTRPDVVIMNLSLPARIGELVFSLLRSSQPTATILVVFLIDQCRWGRRARDHAADAVVPWPWAPEQVLPAVCRVAPCAASG